MRSDILGDKLASRQVKESPQKEALWKEEVKFEIQRLRTLLRDPALSEEEKGVAQSQIANYRQMVLAARPPADWLGQIYLLVS